MGKEAERYNIIREKAGFSKKDFAKSLGISMAMGFQLSTGRLKPSREVMERLASVHNVNLHWFLTGEGPSGLDTDSAEIELLEQEAAAGTGREVEDYAEKRTFQVPFSLVAPHKPESLKAVYVAGDSMTGEKINSGDIVIFRPNPQPQGNGIYVLSVDNALVVKRVNFEGPGHSIELISANPAYAPRCFTGQDLESLRIAGRVVACLHRV
jgi:SOS-response transcriptional repressor LexA